MTVQAQFLNPNGEVKHTLAAAAVSGEVIDGTTAFGYSAGVIAGAGESYAIGDVVTVYTKGVFRVPKLTGYTPSAGDRVEWDDTNNRAVAATGGDFELGTVVKDTGAELWVDVAINDTPLT